MLRTNTKDVKNAIHEYMLSHAEDVACNYEIDAADIETIETFSFFMFLTFKAEMLNHDKAYKAGRVSMFEMFKQWAAGLAFSGMFDYYYHPTAKELVSEWLQETEEEKNRYTESEAEELATRLIYREMFQAADRCSF